jgi:ribosomal protein S12 methylthiotransferase
MEIQRRISEEVNRQKIGKKFIVMIDRLEGDHYIGRTEYDSPEVDGEVLIPRSSAVLETGKFYEAKVVDATEFDLFGKILPIKK